MKFILALASLVATSWAVSIPKDAAWYTFQTNAKTNTLSNKYLTAKNGKVAVYPGVSAQSAGKFFTTEYKDKASGVSTTSFHFGDDTHQLGLSGKGGLLSLVDLVNPSAKTVDFSTPTEWSVFGISSSGNLEVKDGQSIPSRKWVTYLDTDGVQYVGLWDGVSKQPRTVEEIQIVVKKASSPK